MTFFYANEREIGKIYVSERLSMCLQESEIILKIIYKASRTKLEGIYVVLPYFQEN